MFQDIVRAIFLIGFHKGLYILTYFFISCPENRKVIIMEIKVSQKNGTMPACDENIKY